MSKLDKRRKGVYGPPLGKKFIVFVDDINMPDKDDVDSQPPIELLRQLLDHQTWYDNKELFPMKLIEMQVIGAMRPPDGSSKAMSGRFIRHFNTVNVDLVRKLILVSIKEYMNDNLIHTHNFTYTNNLISSYNSINESNANITTTLLTYDNNII